MSWLKQGHHTESVQVKVYHDIKRELIWPFSTTFQAGHRWPKVFRGSPDRARHRLWKLGQIYIFRSVRNSSVSAFTSDWTAANLPVSTAFVESSVNEIIAKRMNKKQQMRWNRATVQPFLDVRTAVLNDTLEDVFRRRYPGFRPANGDEVIALAG
jgi:hypothetical protein